MGAPAAPPSKGSNISLLWEGPESLLERGSSSSSRLGAPQAAAFLSVPVPSHALGRCSEITCSERGPPNKCQPTALEVAARDGGCGGDRLGGDATPANISFQCPPQGGCFSDSPLPTAQVFPLTGPSQSTSTSPSQPHVATTCSQLGWLETVSLPTGTGVPPRQGTAGLTTEQRPPTPLSCTGLGKCTPSNPSSL